MVRSIVVALGLAACTAGTTTDITMTDQDSGTVEPTTTADSFVHEDVYTQIPIDPVDFIWLIDPTWDTGFDNLQNVRETGYETLLLADSDWKMGFTSTDVQNPANRGIIRGIHQTVFPPEGTWQRPRGKDIARPRDAVIAMLEEREETNENFFREGAHLHLMVVTNQRDRSDTTVEEFRGALDERIKDGLTESVRMSAIVRGSEQLVADWRRLTDEFGGTTFVAGSWERGINEIYLHGVNRRREFALTMEPLSAPRSVTVRVREQNTTLEFGQGEVEYIGSRNVIRFLLEPPEVGATIRVRYPVAN